MLKDLFITKPIEPAPRVDAGEPVEGDLHGEATLKRTLTASQLIMLGIGAVIGAGIFVLTGQAAAEYAGPAIMLSFVLAGVACAFAGLCYAEFAAMLPVSGSAYSYSYATLGEFVAWFIGWCLVLEYLFAASTVAVGWSGYLNSFLGTLGLALPDVLSRAPIGRVGGEFVHTGALLNLPAVVIVAAVTGLCYVGITQSAFVNSIIVAIKVTIILLFVALGFHYMDAQNLDACHAALAAMGNLQLGAGGSLPQDIAAAAAAMGLSEQSYLIQAERLRELVVACDAQGGAGMAGLMPPATEGDHYGPYGIIRAASIVFFAYIGFDAVSTAAGEARNPQRDMPIGILGSLVLCTVIYILVCAALVGLMPFPLLGTDRPVATALEAHPQLLWLKTFVEIAAIAGLSSVILVMLMAQPRIFYTMSRDGLLPKLFGKVHPRFHTPYVGTLIVGVVAATLAGFLPINLLGEMVSMGTLLAFATVCAGVLILRYTKPDVHRPFRVPLAIIVSPLGVASCLYLFSQPFREYWGLFLGWTAIGLLIYGLYGYRHSKLRRR